MRKIAFLFPGQGAQYVGMGKDLYEKSKKIQKLYENASKILGIDIVKLTFDSTEEELSKTENTQIAIFLMSLGILEMLKDQKIEAEFAAGLSLGEYSALTYAGILEKEDAIKIVKKRGEIMATNLPKGNWSMAAVIGTTDEKVEELCKSVEKGFVVPANYNCPGQVAISGDKEGVEEAIQKAKDFGARKAIELKTSGPFHTEKLKEASMKLKEEFNQIQIKEVSDIKVIKNMDGFPYQKEDDVQEILAKHVMSPVRFSKSVEYMIQQGVDTFIEIGPGKVLSGFVKKISKEVDTFHIQDLDSLEETIKALQDKE